MYLFSIFLWSVISGNSQGGFKEFLTQKITFRTEKKYKNEILFMQNMFFYQQIISLSLCRRAFVEKIHRSHKQNMSSVQKTMKMWEKKEPIKIALSWLLFEEYDCFITAFIKNVLVFLNNLLWGSIRKPDFILFSFPTIHLFAPTIFEPLSILWLVSILKTSLGYYCFPIERISNF